MFPLAPETLPLLQESAHNNLQGDERPHGGNKTDDLYEPALFPWQWTGACYKGLRFNFLMASTSQSLHIA